LSSTRRTAIVAGAFFILAAVSAVVALLLYGPVLNSADFVVSGSGGDSSIFAGALCELILAASCIGTAVTLFPVVKRENEAIALGYVAGRTVEAVVILVGVISLLAVVTLRQHPPAGTTADGLIAVARALVAIHDWTFLIGPGFAIGVNTSLLAYLMYASRLVPRVIPIVGLIGGPLIFLSSTAILFGLYPQVSTPGGLAAIPVTLWELSLAVWMIVRGLREEALVR
jgi:hypothetical protein